MSVVAKILAFFVGVVVLGALLAPPLYWAGQAVARNGALTFLADTDFQKFFNRAVLIAALALLWPTIRSLKIRGAAELGIERNERRWLHLAVGFLAAFLLMAALAGLLLHLGVYRLKQELPWKAIGKIAVTAAVVSTLEEWIFRGAILGLFRRATSTWVALFLSSALFSVLHFLQPDDVVIARESVGWLSGFRLIPGLFAEFADPVLVLAGFTTLFLVAWILGWTVIRTRSLWMAIGLHAGWILGTMGFSKLTKRVMKETLPWFGPDLTVGIGSIVAVAATGLLVWGWMRYVEADYHSSRV